MVCLFYGNDIKLLKKRLEEWETDLFSKNKNIEKIVIDSFNQEYLKKVIGSENSLFFSAKYIKIYVQKKEEIESILNLKSEDDSEIINIIFYTEKEIEKIRSGIKVYPFFMPKPYKIAEIIFEKFKKNIDPLIVDFLSKNITSLLDLEKIENYLKENPDKSLTINDISYVIEEIDVSIFSIIDDIINRKKSTALYEIINFLDESSYGGLIKNLFSSFKNLYVIKKMINKGVSENEIVRNIGIHPYFVKKYIEIAKKTETSKLENLIMMLPLIDSKSKKFSDKYFLEKMVLDV